ncbi:MAG: FliA/WhiG family RNA polymerase sigma factor [Gemmatimonadota bacterium]
MSALRHAVAHRRAGPLARVPAEVTTSDAGSDDSLWRRYRRGRDLAARAELLNRNLYLVRLLARKLALRIGGAVEVDDLMSAGTLGLVQALESFDLSRGYSFATFASRRIHGAMLDELRSRDWAPRSVRSKARKLNQASARIESVTRRAAAPSEVAAVLEIDVPTYWSWRNSVDGAAILSLEDSASSNDGQSDLASKLGERDVIDAHDQIEARESVSQLASSIAALPERERTVLVLYFYEELNLRQIADILHLTESRISQIRTSALRRLKSDITIQLAS